MNLRYWNVPRRRSSDLQTSIPPQGAEYSQERNEFPTAVGRTTTFGPSGSVFIDGGLSMHSDVDVFGVFPFAAFNAG
jgi:hypothetical protein